MNRKQQIDYRGSTLITVLLFFQLFSLLFFLLIEDYQLTRAYSINTSDFYTAKIMTSMFLTEVQTKAPLEKEGIRTYSKGTIDYQVEDKKIEMIVKISDKAYIFYETLNF